MARQRPDRRACVEAGQRRHQHDLDRVGDEQARVHVSARDGDG